MKRKTACTLLLAFVLVLQLCACVNSAKQESTQKDTPVFDVSDDVPVILVDDEKFRTETRLKDYVQQGLGIPVQVIALSAHGEERESQISALRAEIMAGGGPDAFILTSGTEGIVSYDDGTSKTSFFKNPEKMMRNGIFLPLDELIAQSEHLKMEDHYEVIMDAGRTEEGQIILPLLYSCPSSFVYTSALEDPNMELNTWEDIRTCRDVKVLDYLKRNSLLWFGEQYSNLVDYESGAMLVTQETLKSDCAMLNSFPESAKESLETPIFEDVYSDEGLSWIANESKDISILSVPNDTGGLTATITAYAAINRNTKFAEEVFRVIELLYCEEVQTNQSNFRVGDEQYWVPRPSETLLGTYSGIVTSKNAYSEEQNELISSLNSKINSVRFASDIDKIMFDLAINTTILQQSSANTNIEETTKKAHSEIQMILAE